MQSTESIQNLILRVFYVYEKTLIFRLKIILQSLSLTGYVNWKLDLSAFSTNLRRKEYI